MKQGFTLLEMAIVLAIIGLVAGGITFGADLLEQSKHKKLVEQITELRTAVETFKTTYDALPGDYYRATQVWGAAASCPTGGTTGTCNGNGDGSYDAAATEMRHFAQHLALAKLIEGAYNSNWTGGATPGVHAISTPFKGVGITVMSMPELVAGGATTDDNWWYDGKYGNVFRPGRPNNAGGCPTCFNNWISCEQALNVDKKYDDGMPGTGFIRGGKEYCTTTGNAVADPDGTATYTARYDPDLTTTTIQVYVWENSM